MTVAASISTAETGEPIDKDAASGVAATASAPVAASTGQGLPEAGASNEPPASH